MEQIKNIISKIVCFIPQLITIKINESLTELTHIVGDIDLNDSQMKKKITSLLLKFASDLGSDIGKFIRSLLNDFPPFDIIFNVQKLTKIMITLNKYNEIFKNINDDDFMDKLNNLQYSEEKEKEKEKENPAFSVLDSIKSNITDFAELIMDSFIQKLLNTIGKIKKPSEGSIFSNILMCNDSSTNTETENTIDMVNSIGNDKIELIKRIITETLRTIMDNFSNSFYNAIVDNANIKPQQGGLLLKKLQRSKNEILKRIKKDILNFKNTNKSRKYANSKPRKYTKRCKL